MTLWVHLHVFLFRQDLYTIYICIPYIYKIIYHIYIHTCIYTIYIFDKKERFYSCVHVFISLYMYVSSSECDGTRVSLCVCRSHRIVWSTSFCLAQCFLLSAVIARIGSLQNTRDLASFHAMGAPELKMLAIKPYFTWVLGFELSSLCLQGKYINHWAISPARWITL